MAFEFIVTFDNPIEYKDDKGASGSVQQELKDIGCSVTTLGAPATTLYVSSETKGPAALRDAIYKGLEKENEYKGNAVLALINDTNPKRETRTAYSWRINIEESNTWIDVRHSSE